MRRVLAGLVLSGAILTAAAPAALGHECYIVNRSDMGNAGALHSSRWVQLDLATIFGFINEEVGGDPLSASQIDWAVDEAVSEGLPRDGWVTRSDKTIGEGSKNPNLANGKGLDHLADVYGEQIGGIYFAALGH